MITHDYPTCPICGAEAQTFYRDRAGEMVGCDECIKIISWDDLAAEQEANAYDAYVDREVDVLLERMFC